MAQPIITYSLTWGANNVYQKLSGKTYINPSGQTVDCSTLTVTFSSSVHFKKFYATVVKSGKDYGFENDILVDIKEINPTGILLYELTERNANVNFSFIINYSSLLEGDGEYRIGLYIQNDEGVWNYEYFLLESGNIQLEDTNNVLLQAPTQTASYFDVKGQSCLQTIDLQALCIDGYGYWNSAYTSCAGFNSDTNWIWSTYIPVGKGKIVYNALKLHQSVPCVTFWDKNGNQLGIIKGDKSTITSITGEYVLPIGTRFIKLNLRNYQKFGDTSQSILFVGETPLPHRYQQLDYIESTGTQYIDTGIIPPADIVQDIYFTPTSISTDEKFYGMSGMAGVFLGTINGHYRLSSSLTESNINVAANKTRAISINTNWKINGIDATAGIVSAGTKSIYLFGCRYTAENNPVLFGKMQLHQFLLSTSINKNSYKYAPKIPLGCFIPCKDLLTNELGVYDIVNERFLTNLGTGYFNSSNSTT